jgi:hypothetical protein
MLRHDLESRVKPGSKRAGIVHELVSQGADFVLVRPNLVSAKPKVVNTYSTLGAIGTSHPF